MMRRPHRISEPGYKTSKAQRRASAKWTRENRANITFQTTPERRAEVQAYAQKIGLSMSRLLDAAVTEYMQRHPAG